MKPRLLGVQSTSHPPSGPGPPPKAVALVAACGLAAIAVVLAPVGEFLHVTLAALAAGCSLALAVVALAASTRSRALAGETAALVARLAAADVERRDLEHERRMEALRSSTDELTGVLSRRALKEAIRKEANRALRHERPLACLFIDVDRFKRINDVHGHGVGDEVLVELAIRIRSAVRDYDLFGRWGGDEFFLVAPEHRRAADTRVLGEKIREAVAAAPFPTQRGPVAVTISVGVVLVDPATPSPEEMCALADGALYRAKRAGRNRVEVDDPSRGAATTS